MPAPEIPAPIRQDTHPEQHATLHHYRRLRPSLRDPLWAVPRLSCQFLWSALIGVIGTDAP